MLARLFLERKQRVSKNIIGPDPILTRQVSPEERDICGAFIHHHLESGPEAGLEHNRIGRDGLQCPAWDIPRVRCVKIDEVNRNLRHRFVDVAGASLDLHLGKFGAM